MEINWTNIIEAEKEQQFYDRLDEWAVMMYGKTIDDLEDHQRDKVLRRAMR